MSAGEDDRLARVALSRIVEPGHVGFLDRVAVIGAVAVREQTLAGADSPKEAARTIAERLSAIDPTVALEQAQRLGLRFVVPGDDEWPTRLDDLRFVEPLHERTGIPLGLWVKGPLRLTSLEESVSVVGARSATTYGATVAGEIASTAARAGWSVVSGAAFGIDQAAHRGALSAGGTTVAVLACGADRIYPEAHRGLLEHLATHHAVVSEAAPGWAPTRIRFLARNRLIAALTRGTVVVEAALRSGALNSATWADRLSRSVMGVPGPVTSAQSQGVHQLMRRGGAVVTSGADVLEHLGGAGDHLQEDERGPARPRDQLGEPARQVIEAVPAQLAVGSSSIALCAGLPQLEVLTALRTLRDHGLVEQVEAGWRLSELGRA